MISITKNKNTAKEKMFSNPAPLIKLYIIDNVLLLIEELLDSYNYSVKIIMLIIKIISEINLVKLNL
jgi:hypothetical protein